VNTSELIATARAMVPKGRGILAADESTGTIKKRFDGINVASTEETRRAYRDLLFSTPGAEAYISGVIFYDETIRQASSDGTPFPRLLESKGVVPGIKVDTGAMALAGFPGEKVTEGLDGLRERLIAYRQIGARFAKWRAVITLGPGMPTTACIKANAHALARYAALCQEQNIVPIVEPEVLMDGDHTIERYEDVTTETLNRVFHALAENDVFLEGIVLKPNMVLSGSTCPVQAGAQQVAEATVRTLLRTVPAAVPGIAFLSGGQTPVQSTENLSAMNALGTFPWELSFSYGRALQQPVLQAWKGAAGNVAAAQAAYLHRAKMNGLARSGKWTGAAEQAA
jgi:fructose-bisphosphate aldolase, class I